MGAHGETANQTAFDKRVRIVAQNFPVLAGSRFGFIRVDHEVMRSAIAPFFGRHEGPLHPGREARAPATTQTRGFDLIDQLFAAEFKQRLGVVPDATLARAFETPVVTPVEIFKDAVFVTQHHAPSAVRVVRPPSGSEPERPTREPASGISPRLRDSRTALKLSAVRSS